MKEQLHYTAIDQDQSTGNKGAFFCRGQEQGHKIQLGSVYGTLRRNNRAVLMEVTRQSEDYRVHTLRLDNHIPRIRKKTDGQDGPELFALG